jgi:integrase
VEIQPGHGQPRKKLTAASIACLKPREDRYEVSDNGSPLRLVVYPSGRKVFILRYRRPTDGRAAKLTLGPFDGSGESSEAPVIGAPLTLAGARMLAATALRAKAHGRDPAAERRAAKDVSGRPETFADVLPLYLAHIEKHNRCAKEMSDVLRGFATVWAARPLAEMDAQACHELVERCRLKGLPGRKVLKPQACESRARLAHALLQGFFSWAVRQRKLERSPIHGLEAPSTAPERDRVLDDAEMRAFWTACESLSPWHCAALRLLLLTGQRRQEISELRWDEFDVEFASIRLSPQRTKNKRAHSIPLSTFAREIINATPRVDGCPFVFSYGRVPICAWAEIKEKLDAAMRAQGWNGPAFRLHDLRRTCATGLAKQGTPIHVTEKILNHASGTLSGVAAIYNRYDYAQEMREALERWSETVRQLVGQDFGFSRAHGTQATSEPLQRR